MSQQTQLRSILLFSSLLHSNTLDKNQEFTKLKILTFCRASSYVICGKIKRRTADILIPHESAITLVS